MSGEQILALLGIGTIIAGSVTLFQLTTAGATVLFQYAKARFKKDEPTPDTVIEPDEDDYTNSPGLGGPSVVTSVATGGRFVLTDAVHGYWLPIIDEELGPRRKAVGREQLVLAGLSDRDTHPEHLPYPDGALRRLTVQGEEWAIDASPEGLPYRHLTKDVLHLADVRKWKFIGMDGMEYRFSEAKEQPTFEVYDGANGSTRVVECAYVVLKIESVQRVVQWQ